MERKLIRLPKKYALTKELWIILTVKCCLLFLIWKIFFANPVENYVTESSIAQHLYNGANVTRENQGG